MFFKEYDQIKDQIAQQARMVFSKLGYTKVSMDDIAKVAGKSRSTLYHYFKNKKEVFEYLAETELNSIIDFALVGVDQRLELEENLLKFHRRKFNKITQLISDAKPIINELRINKGLLTAYFNISHQKEMDALVLMLNWAQEKNEISPIAPKDKYLLAKIITNAIGSFEEEVYTREKEKNFDKQIQWLIKLLVKGLK